MTCIQAQPASPIDLIFGVERKLLAFNYVNPSYLHILLLNERSFSYNIADQKITNQGTLL